MKGKARNCPAKVFDSRRCGFARNCPVAASRGGELGYLQQESSKRRSMYYWQGY